MRVETHDDEFNAHELTLEFWRFLTEDEFREVVQQVRAHVSHVRQLRATAVRVTDAQVAASTEAEPASASTTLE
jgi:hypothetical protein